jgi:integrase
LRKLPWSAYDGERISLVQGKRKRAVSIKCTAALKAHLDSLERRGLLILLTRTGHAWTKRYLNEKWNESCRAAGIATDLHFHDLRGTAVTMLAQAGCSVPEIAAITGHSLKDATSILETYLARTKQLADAGVVKFDEWLAKNRLQPG